MGFKYHIVYVNDENEFWQYESVNIAAGSLDEALMLFRRKHNEMIILICLLS